MKYEDIRGFFQRCEEHPDHQSGMISHQMLLDRAHEEIDELREYIEAQPKREWVGLTDEEYKELQLQTDASYFYLDYGVAIETKLKEKNT